VAKEYAETRKKEWRLWGEIRKYFFARSKFRVLDLGCGSGRLLDYLKRDFKGKFEYMGVDYAKNMIKVAKKRHPNFQGSNFPDSPSRGLSSFARSNFQALQDQSLDIPGMGKQSFDLVTMIASYHHVFGRGERVDLLKGIKRVLKPGGKLLITVWVIDDRGPESRIKRIDFQGKSRYYILLGKKQLERELSEVFDEVEVRFDRKKQNLIAVAC
jgi:SAM-dependent methyltransferase